MKRLGRSPRIQMYGAQLLPTYSARRTQPILLNLLILAKPRFFISIKIFVSHFDAGSPDETRHRPLPSDGTRAVKVSNIDSVETSAQGARIPEEIESKEIWRHQSRCPPRPPPPGHHRSRAPCVEKAFASTITAENLPSARK